MTVTVDKRKLAVFAAFWAVVVFAAIAAAMTGAVVWLVLVGGLVAGYVAGAVLYFGNK